MKTEYLTVSQFAKKVGVSPQYVYRQLDTKLSDFVETVDGKKMIRSDALGTFQKKTKQGQTTDQQLLNILREQLQAKDKQIEELQAIIKAEQSLRYASESRLKAIEDRLQEQTEESTNESTESGTGANTSRTATPATQERSQGTPSLWKRFIDYFRD